VAFKRAGAEKYTCLRYELNVGVLFCFLFSYFLA
jgi:hypothetical protein